MILTPMAMKGFDVAIPPRPDSADPPRLQEAPNVSLEASGRVFVNGRPAEVADLGGLLAGLLDARSERTVFFRADEEASYERAVEVMGAVAAVSGRIGIVTAEAR